MIRLSQKESGAYFSPEAVVRSLVRWAVHDSNDRMLDPSCGDGRFLACHRKAVGVEQDPVSAAEAIKRAPWALVHEGDFFSWAKNTKERFECIAGNPPFIRYQLFKGEIRERAMAHCRSLGADFSGLSSSWAPFLVAAGALLKQGGRMAFIVPAELGHAPYSAPLMAYLVANFGAVHVVAVREKLFPHLSEDCWLLYAEQFGRQTHEVRFTALDRFVAMDAPPEQFTRVSVNELQGHWRGRLRPFLLPEATRYLYSETAANPRSVRLGEVANVGIGYVSGGNDFFHLSQSAAREHHIPKEFLFPTVRNGRALPDKTLSSSLFKQWVSEEQSVFLLRLPRTKDLPRPVLDYLDTSLGKEIRNGTKCRQRNPFWYSVPDVQVPRFFLSYMSGHTPSLVYNAAGCSCTNSVHAVRVKQGVSARHVASLWGTSFVQLSCELQGHPLGGGMLKIEPGEAQQLVLPATNRFSKKASEQIEAGLAELRRWRHYAS